VLKYIPDYYNDLDKIYLKIWKLINLGVSSRNFSFHLPTFICGNDKNFDGRVVVLRGVDEKNKKIWFHADIRSKKIKILKKNPKVSFLFYDKDEKIQLRIHGTANINYQNNITEKSWKKTLHISRQCYLGEKTPGSVASFATSGLPKNIDNFEYTMKQSENGYKNFCLIENHIKTIEWLYLAAKGHRRAYFNFKKNLIEKKWIIP